MESLPQFNVVDVIALIVIVLGAIRGFAKGLSTQLAGLISVGVAVLIGWIGYRPFGELIWQHTRLSEQAAYAWAFILLLIGGYVLMRLVRLLLKAIMEFSFKEPIEKIGGALAGFARTLVICAAFMLFMGLLPNSFIHTLFAEDSLFGRAAYERLGPVYDSLAERYPSLKMGSEDGDESEFEGKPDFEDGEPQSEDGEYR